MAGVQVVVAGAGRQVQAAVQAVWQVRQAVCSGVAGRHPDLACRCAAGVWQAGVAGRRGRHLAGRQAVQAARQACRRQQVRRQVVVQVVGQAGSGSGTHQARLCGSGTPSGRQVAVAGRQWQAGRCGQMDE